MMKKEKEKTAKKGGAKHEFFVVNLTKEKLKGHVLWKSSGNEVKVDVEGLEPGKRSLRKQSDRVPLRGVAGGGRPRSPARAGQVSWRSPEG
ncbi:hypothetical protein QA645_38470 [Bradyrhizobium sp. CIAT3101]|uniref:hypothetical protein n=1 Tax=Bradyrhizobium sp. CIAT3101 TaxID=439387 RepID=UPI0024B04B19|nr:hypothetical protein [Bradyrhizobium sp. CIAT3101]WFU80322.1 hypothetical protein QA645_38470 [Bradyrhizobium sp. CIAT3101]